MLPSHSPHLSAVSLTVPVDVPSPTVTPRESMRCLPTWMQPLLTALTGQPLADEPARERSPSFVLWTALATLSLGLGLNLWSWTSGDLWLGLLPLGWLLTVSGMRKLQLSVLHPCSHGLFSRSAWVNTWLGEAISLVLVIESFFVYRTAHGRIHHTDRLMTPGEPTHDFLRHILGLAPTMSVSHMWRRLSAQLASPVFYVRLCRRRLAAQFSSEAPLIHWALAALWLGGQVWLVTMTHSWATFLVVWLFPLTVLYEISRTLRLCVEHLWPRRNTKSASRSENLSLTQAVFLGEATPSPTLTGWEKVAAWSLWWARMAFVHLLARVFVLVGDTPNHDYHHRHPASRKWSYAAFARRDNALQPRPSKPPYVEQWGLGNAIESMFVSLRQSESRVVALDA